MRRSSVRLLLSVFLLAFGTTAKAGSIPYDSFSGTVIDFDGLTGSISNGDGEELTNQFTSLGVTFSVPNFGSYAMINSFGSLPTWIWVDQGSGSGGALAGGLQIDFATPQTHVGLAFMLSVLTTLTVDYYDGATLVETITTPDLLGSLAATSPRITRVIVSSTGEAGEPMNFGFDDLKFTAVPEPSTFVMLAFGLGLAAYRRLGNQDSR